MARGKTRRSENEKFFENVHNRLMRQQSKYQSFNDDNMIDITRIENISNVVTRHGEHKTVVTMRSGDKVWLRGHLKQDITELLIAYENRNGGIIHE